MLRTRLLSRRRFAALLARLAGACALPWPARAAPRPSFSAADLEALAGDVSGDVIPRSHAQYDLWRHSMTW